MAAGTAYGAVTLCQLRLARLSGTQKREVRTRHGLAVQACMRMHALITLDLQMSASRLKGLPVGRTPGDWLACMHTCVAFCLDHVAQHDNRANIPR